MASPGFELLYSSVAQQVRSADDASIVAVHWNLISNGFKCCGTGEVWPDQQNANISGSEAMPAGWNSDATLYALRYVEPTSNRTYLMKALAMDGNLMLNLVRCFDEKAASVTIRSRDYVNEDMSTSSSTYSNLSGLNSSLTNDLVNKVTGTGPGGTSQGTSPPAASTDQQRRDDHPGRSPLLEDPRRGPGAGGLGYMPPRQPFRPGFADPFGVGRADLDPLAGGMGGGMFMDPRNFPTPGGGFRPGFGPGPAPPGFPPGSIPPGARFDPLGPPGTRPGPDPDHERPPDNYDDMFM
ncbi:proteasome inhibitor PI31 subunit [Aplysia californica]|uniref:Proteasome inhibitor PI31 subunit n=1 Tax=Aplysia californica TaxID=6500 RepID=A0ABM1A2X3_APLCA|nr:proteasome inhibitor PI31 subunit [Aplysia californica]